VGLAITEEPVVVFNPVPGLHENVLAPPAVNVAELPLHIVAEFTVTVKAGRTVTVIVLDVMLPQLVVFVTK
jgi:hypothetical protein